jgi:hypothetical protein
MNQPVIVRTWRAPRDGVRIEMFAPRNRRLAQRLAELEESTECLAEIVNRAERLDDEERARVGSNADGLTQPATDAGNRQP